MGLFSDRCESCSATVKKAAKFCNKCGTPAPGGWVKCPGCKKWVGNECHHCSSCNYNLRPDERELISNDTIKRSSNFFMRRFELDIIKTRLKKELKIELGTMAYVIKNQKEVLVLNSGAVKLESFWDKLLSFGKKDDLSFNLIDAGELAVPVRVSGLMSEDMIAFDVYTEAIIQIDPSEAEAFIVNFVKEKRELSLNDIAVELHKAVKDVYATLAREVKLEDLLMDPQRRLLFEESISNALYSSMDNVGLNIIRVAVPQIEGKEVRAFENKHKQEMEQVRELAYKGRMRKLMTDASLEEMKTDAEVEDFANQLAFESGVKQEGHKFELESLMQVHRHEIEGKEAAFQLSEQMKVHEHDLAKARKSLSFETEESREWMKVRQEKDAMKREDEFIRLKEYDKYDLKTLVAALPPEQAKNLVEMHKITERAGMPDVVILDQLRSTGGIDELARQASIDPSAARRLADSLSHIIGDKLRK